MRNSTSNSLQLILLILKMEYVVSEKMLEDIGVQTIISGLQLHTVPLIKFDINLVNYIVLAAANDLEWQEAYNIAKDSNLRINIEYLHRALYFKERL
jgi:hypothetical protein